MRISRRDLLRRLGRGAVAGTALSLVDTAHAEMVAAPPMHRHDGPIRLNMNENAYGASDRATAALRIGLGEVHRYPDSEQMLVAMIAYLHRVAPEQVVLGCGARGILRTAAAAFLGPGKKLVLASPTFDAIARYARAIGADVASVSLDARHAHDLERMLARADASTGLVYICNPNNPTGSLTRRADLEAFIRRVPATTRVLIDEAYHDYVGESSAYASFIDRPVDDDRVIVMRTFSKIYGLAGLRLGYAIAHTTVARELASRQPAMEVNALALAAGMAAIGDRQHVRRSLQRNANDRQEFYNQANTRMLRVIDSHTNFFMMKTGRPAAAVIDHLHKHDILVGPPVPTMARHIRVSLGIPAEMREFWRIWDTMAPQRTHM